MGQSCLRAPRSTPSHKRGGHGVSSRSATSVTRNTFTSNVTAVARPASQQGSGSRDSNTGTSSGTHLCSHNACTVLRRKDWEATERMVRTGEGVDINMTKLLERALYEGCPSTLIELILEKGANPLDSTRCLADAILGKAELRIIERLLDLGCSPNQESQQDKLKRTPVHFACQVGSSQEIINLLIARGGDLNQPVGERQWTAVHYLACANHDAELLTRIVAMGAQINARAQDGTTPMAVAAFKRAPEAFFRKMLALGADPSLQTRHKRTPLYYLRNTENASIRSDDVRFVLLHPMIHRKQLFALAHGLHVRLGRDSDVSKLNQDLLALVGEFLLGIKKIKVIEEEHPTAIEYDDAD